MMVYALTSDYLDVQQTTAKIWAGQHREASAFSRSVAPTTASPPNPLAGRQTRGGT